MFVLVLNMAYNHPTKQPTKRPTKQHPEYRASPDFGLTGWNWKSGDWQYSESFFPKFSQLWSLLPKTLREQTYITLFKTQLKYMFKQKHIKNIIFAIHL